MHRRDKTRGDNAKTITSLVVETINHLDQIFREIFRHMKLKLIIPLKNIIFLFNLFSV